MLLFHVVNPFFEATVEIHMITAQHAAVTLRLVLQGAGGKGQCQLCPMSQIQPVEFLF